MMEINKTWEKRMRAAIKRGHLTGWIEEIADPWESLPCIGSMDNINNNCEECPLSDQCEEMHNETLYH